MKNLILINLTCFVLGGLAVWKLFPPTTVEQERVVYKDRVQKVIEEVIVETPDGTKTTERVTYKDQTSDKEATNKVTKAAKKNNWGVSVQTTTFVSDPVTTVGLHRRVFGDFYVSIHGSSNGTVQAGLLFTF